MLHVQEAMQEVKVAKLCRLFEVPRSSFYYRSSRRDESEVKKAVEEVAAVWPRFGYQGLTGQLRFEEKSDPRGKPIGERRVKRLLKELGLLRKPHTRKVRTTNSEHGLPRFENLVQDRKAICPDEIWASGYPLVGDHLREAWNGVCLSVGDPGLVYPEHPGMAPVSLAQRGGDPDCSQKALDSGDRCAAHHGGRCPQIHHSDQGVQYAADDYVKLLQSRGVAISMAAVGCPEENGFAERWMRTLKEDHVSMSEYADFLDCQAQIGEFIEEVYQRKRVHSSLGYLPPAVFEERWWEAKAQKVSGGNGGEPLRKSPQTLPAMEGSVTIPQT